MKKYIGAKTLLILVICFIAVFIAHSAAAQTKRKEAKAEQKQIQHKVLVFYKTTGWKHASLPQGRAALHKLGQENGFAVDTTANDAYFTPEKLKQYQAVVFLSTSKEVLNDAQQRALQDWVRAGGGFMGIHGATDTEYEWTWYNQLVGAQFDSHPKDQTAVIQVVDKSHPATQHLPDEWKRFDEWYNFQNLQPHLQVLMKLDEKSYEGGKHGNDHPIAWYQEFEGSRSFYTALGHTPESYSEPLFLQHLLGGLQWVMKQTPQ